MDITAGTVTAQDFSKKIGELFPTPFYSNGKHFFFLPEILTTGKK